MEEVLLKNKAIPVHLSVSYQLNLLIIRYIYNYPKEAQDLHLSYKHSHLSIKELVMSDIYKILVAEQKALISKHLKQKLNRKQTLVFTVHSMSEAIDHLKFIDFNILVVDVQSNWNDQNDFQILRSIRWMLPQIRIILLISKEKIKKIDNLEGLEISDLISKPWKNKDLVISITNVIEKSPICLSKI